MKMLLTFFAMFFCVSTLTAQIQIKGKVVDKASEPLIGVAVSIKGTTSGTMTDINGDYSIEASNRSATLVFSYLGFNTVEEAVNNKSVINVILKEQDNYLDEVVVVGFGTQKKINLTGAVGIINAKDLADRPVQNATQALQGLLPGLNISQKSGSMDSRASIDIRGVGTIGEGSAANPLILIDGMEGDLYAINPQDIENISVLKDAAASSIYGSRAAFGVILVTTKRGVQGSTKVNYNNSFRISSPILNPKMMDSYTFALYFNDAGRNVGWNDHFSQEHLQRIKDYQSGKITASIIPNPGNPKDWSDGYSYGNDNVDWYDVYFKKNTFAQEHNLSVTGGNDKVSYYVSGNFLNQNGLLKIADDDFSRYAVTAKINGTVNNWLSLNYSGRFIREDFERPASLNDDFYWDVARQGWPTLPHYDPNGYLHQSSLALGLTGGGRDKFQNDWLYQQFQVVIEPIKGWKTFGELNYKICNNFRHWDIQAYYAHDVDGNPYLRSTWPTSVHEEAYRENYFNPNIYSEYSKIIANNHNIKGMLGFQSELTNYRKISADKSGIIVPGIPVLDQTNGLDNKGSALPPTVGGLYEDWATAGFFGRLNYDYAGKYLLELNLRYDGTSRYRADQRWNWFPSLSGGWNISREEFWKPIENIVNTTKFRVSYGKLGNQNTKNWYPTYLTMPVGSNDGTWLVNGSKPNTAKGPGLISTFLTWERVETIDFGVDLGFLNNRLTSSFDYFVRNTFDMVGPAPELPSTLGTDVPKFNNTDLKTYGFEFDITWRDQLKNGLSYSAKILLSDSQTEITRYPNETRSFGKYREGQKMGEIWGYKTIGIAKTDEEMQAHLANVDQSAFGSNWAAGDIMYADLDGDNKVDWGSDTEDDRGDKALLGNNTPRFNFGIDLSANWKGFDVRAFFQGTAKRDFWQGSYFFWGATGNMWDSTGFEEHMDYFRDDADHPLGQNLDSYYPRPVFGWTNKNQQVQSRYMLNAAYIRLKNLQLGYTLPTKIVQKAGVQNLRIFFSGENLWTGTKMPKMFDPETVNGDKGGSTYPLSKTFSFGLSINL